MQKQPQAQVPIEAQVQAQSPSEAQTQAQAQTQTQSPSEAQAQSQAETQTPSQQADLHPELLGATLPSVEKSALPTHEWGDREDEVGLHITASVEPLQSAQEISNSQSMITMENAMLDIPLNMEY